jgi:hypothetical protein
MTITEPAAVQFATGSETVNESAGTFSIPVTVTGALSSTLFTSGFSTPIGLAAGAAGDLYVSNAGDGTVSEVSPAGKVSTFASGFKVPFGVAVDAAGNVYVADTGADTVYEVPAGGGLPAPFASGFQDPTGVAFDSVGNLYVANDLTGTVSEVPAGGGAPTTFASGFDGPTGLAFDSAGNLYVANLVDGLVSKVPQAGGSRVDFKGFNNPIGLAFDSTGNLYVADSENNTVDAVTPKGVVSIFATGFDLPTGLALVAGRMYVDDDGNSTMSQVAGLTVPFALGGTAASGVAYSGPTAGVLTFAIGQTTADITGTLLSDPGPTQALTFTLGTPDDGAFVGKTSLNALIINEPAHGPTGPPLFVGEQRVFSQKGKRKQLIGFEFRFNGALDVSSAQTTGNYHVTVKQRKKPKVLRVTSALYNPNNFSVTISVAGFKTSSRAQAVITGLAGADGEAIPEVISGL